MSDNEVPSNKTTEAPVGVNAAGLTSDAKAMFDAIAKRAYQLFELQGRKHGHHLEHWLQAERDLFDRPPLMLSESHDVMILLAEVPGFAPRELEVDLEPRRITIIGKHQMLVGQKQDGNSFAERGNRQLLQRLELPAEIDTHQVTATLSKGVLELDMKKAVRTKRNTTPASSSSQVV